MNTPIAPGLTSYDTTKGVKYRLFGKVRGNATDSDAAAALGLMGLVPLTFYAQGSTLPSDWPVEQSIPVSGDERLFRAEGVWTKDSSMPTATDAGKGSVIIFQLWRVDPAVSMQVEKKDNTLLYVSVGSLAIVGLAAAWLYWSKPRKNPRKLTIEDIGQWIDNDEGLYNWWKESRLSKRKFIQQHRAELEASINNVLEGRKPAHYRAYGGFHEFVDAGSRRDYVGGSSGGIYKPMTENPYRYDSTIRHRGVAIHVHSTDNGFCADYRSIAGFVNDPGDVICSTDKFAAIDEAKNRIDTLFAQTLPQVSGFYE